MADKQARGGSTGRAATSETDGHAAVSELGSAAEQPLPSAGPDAPPVVPSKPDAAAPSAPDQPSEEALGVQDDETKAAQPREEGPEVQDDEAKREQPGEEASEGEDDEAKLEHDLEELAAKAQKADEYLELAQRTKADFENYRKRAAREAAAAQERGVIKLAKELLPAVDNLDRALAAAESARDGDELLSGIKLVHAGVIAALARVGIEPFSPEGEKFDPIWHEAVAQQPSEQAEPGTVVEVYQRGYRLRDNVLRPAKVVVAG